MSDYIFDFIVIFIIGLLIYKFISILKTIKLLRQRDNVLNQSGCEIASKLLENSNLEGIYVVKTSNPFDEGYKDDRNTIKLSSGIFDNTTISDMVLVSRICSKIILLKENNLFRLKNNIIKLLDITNILIYLAIIIFSLFKYMYYLKITIIIFIITIFVRIIFLNYEKEINNKAKEELNKLKLIDEINNDKINKLFDELTYNVVVNPILIIYNLFRLINNKMK